MHAFLTFLKRASAAAAMAAFLLTALGAGNAEADAEIEFADDAVAVPCPPVLNITATSIAAACSLGADERPYGVMVKPIGWTCKAGIFDAVKNAVENTAKLNNAATSADRGLATDVLNDGGIARGAAGITANPNKGGTAKVKWPECYTDVHLDQLEDKMKKAASNYLNRFPQ